MEYIWSAEPTHFIDANYSVFYHLNKSPKLSRADAVAHVYQLLGNRTFKYHMRNRPIIPSISPFDTLEETLEFVKNQAILEE